MKRYLANTISLSRLLLFVPWRLCFMADSPWTLPVMGLIILTDLMDGPVARRLNTAGPFGGALDAACDLSVVVACAVTIGIRDARYAVMAGLMAVNFASWLVLAGGSGAGRYTSTGRYNGAACYALIAAADALRWLPAAARTAGHLIEWAALDTAAVLLCISTIENASTALIVNGKAHDHAGAI